VHIESALTCCRPIGQFRQGPELLWHVLRLDPTAAQVARGPVSPDSTHSAELQYRADLPFACTYTTTPTVLYRGRTDTTALILNFCTRWRCVVSFTPRPYYHQYPVNGGLILLRASREELQPTDISVPSQKSNPGPSSPWPSQCNNCTFHVLTN